MAKVMFQFRHAGDPPTLEDIRAAFGLHPEEIDPNFGVVLTDSQEKLYVVLIDQTAQDRVSARLNATGADPSVGVFSNPPVEPFGPPHQEGPTPG